MDDEAQSMRRGSSDLEVEESKRRKALEKAVLEKIQEMEAQEEQRTLAIKKPATEMHGAKSSSQIVQEPPGGRCINVLQGLGRGWITDLALVGSRLFVASNQDVLSAMAVSGNLLFSCSDSDTAIKARDVETLQVCEALTQHTMPVTSLLCSGGLLFSGSLDTTVCVLDVQTLQCRGTLKGHTGAVFSLAQSAGRVFSAGFDTTIKVWDSSTCECLRTLLGHENTVVALAVADGYLFSGSKDKTMRVWSLKTLECVRVLGEHTGSVLALAVGDNIVVAASGDTVRIYDLDDLCSGRELDEKDDSMDAEASDQGEGPASVPKV